MLGRGVALPDGRVQILLRLGAAKLHEQLVLRNLRAVIDRHVDHHAVHFGEHVAAIDRLQRAFGLHIEIGRPDEQRHQQRHHRQGDADGLWQRPGADDPAALAQQTPHRHEKETLVLQRIGQGGRTMTRDHVDPLRHRRRQAAVLDLLDDQRPDGRLGRLGALFRVVLLADARTLQRQHGHGLRVRFVDVLLDGLLDLRGHVLRVARVPDRIARGHYCRRQAGQQADGVGTLVENVLPADGLDDALVALANRHADAVALDQPPPLVGDRVGRFDRFERGMDRAGEILQPRPQHLAVGEMPQLMALEKIGGQFAHLQQESQIAALRRYAHVAPLEDLDQAHQSPGRSATAPAPGGIRSGWPPVRRPQCRNAAAPTCLLGPSGRCITSVREAPGPLRSRGDWSAGN